MSRTLLRLILGLLLVCAIALPALPVAASDGEEYASDRIVVKYRAEANDAEKGEIEERHGDREYRDLPGTGIRVVKVPKGKVAEKLAAYRNEKGILFAEPDYIARAISTPNDPYFGNEWGMTKVQAPQAWDVTTGQATIKIAILDTGVDQSNVELAGKIVANRNFTTSGTVDDLYGHGTFCAGVAAAATNNGVGVAGMAGSASILNVKVLDDTGSGYYSSIVDGITWAADNGASVISMSLGGPSASSALQSAIDYAWSKGVLLVAAAGNNGNSALSYPGAYTNVIAVAATDQNDAKASFSNYGSWVDVAAPGVNIYSIMPDHANVIGKVNYGYLNGTSMATPFVAGEAALIWSTPYGTSNTAVRQRIEGTADAIGGTGTNWRYGRINAARAVAAVTPTPTPTPTTPVPAPAPGFTLSVTPATRTVLQGSSTSYTVAINSTGGFSSPIVLSLAGLPANTTATFSPNPAGLTSALSILTVASTPAGSYNLTVSGTGAGLTRTANMTLVVARNAASELTVSVSPSSQTVRGGGSAAYTVKVTGGSNGAVYLSVSGLPYTGGSRFNRDPVTGNYILTITTSRRTRQGTYRMTVTATSGVLSSSAAAALRVR